MPICLLFPFFNRFPLVNFSIQKVLYSSSWADRKPTPLFHKASMGINQMCIKMPLPIHTTNFLLPNQENNLVNLVSGRQLLQIWPSFFLLLIKAKLLQRFTELHFLQVLLLLLWAIYAIIANVSNKCTHIATGHYWTPSLTLCFTFDCLA